MVYKNKELSLKYYFKGIPEIICYQLLTKALLLIFLWLIRQLIAQSLWIGGVDAITSGDIPFLLRSWQGFLILIIGFILFATYILLDVNMMVLMSKKIMRGEQNNFFKMVKTAFKLMDRMICLRGLVVICFIILIFPLNSGLFGVHMGGILIPDFILYFIKSKIIYYVIYVIIVFLVDFVGVLHIFTFHAMINDGMSLKDALLQSRRLVKKHGKYLLNKYLPFIITIVSIFFASISVGFFLTRFITQHFNLSETVRHFWIIFGTLFVVTKGVILILLFIQLKVIFLSDIYNRLNIKNDYRIATNVRMYINRIIKWEIVALSILIITSIITAYNFDIVFPKTSVAKIIAHRAGGNLALENSIDALEKSIEKGVYGAEIDVQRTLDGYYIINHDDSFLRLYNDRRKVHDMTYNEVKNLTINGDENTKVASLLEMLKAAKGRIHLYIELKGKTADKKMADDVYEMVKKIEMIDHCTFISLDYEEIEYLESQHPDANTLYLCYFSSGNIEKLNVDGIALEIELATRGNIDRLRNYDKITAVWTCNSFYTISRAMTSGAEYVVTDEIELFEDMQKGYEKKNDYARVLDRLMYIIR